MPSDAVDEGDNNCRDWRQREVDLARLADRQDGLVNRSQLRTLGYTARQVRWRLARGRLFPVYTDVFSVGRARITPRAHLRAALLSLSSAAFLTHRASAAARGMRPINIRAIEVTVVGGGVRRRDGLIIHRTAASPHPRDVRTTPDGLRVSSPLRMLLELAAQETSQELARLITLAVQKRLLRLDARDGREEVDEFLARHSRRPGTKALAAALRAYRHPGNSNLEHAFTKLLARHPEIPPPQRNIHIGIWEIDAFWPQQRVAVELDGRPYHVAVDDMERDRRKDIALQRLKITPLRFTDFRVQTDETGIIDDLLHFVVGSP